MNKKILGPAIKFIRKYRRFTQEQMIELTGFKQSTISGHENNKSGLDEEDVRIYAQALQVSPQVLFDVADKIATGEPIKDSDLNVSSIKERFDEVNAPDWATFKNVLDLEKMLDSNVNMAFGGESLSEDDKQRVKDVLTTIFWEKLNRKNK